jgi:predicted GNAT superfamily acetyltransferase
MIQGSNLELALFSDVPEQDTLETLYDLNQENTPEVGSLSSVNELRSLIQLSALNFFVLNEEEIIGFIICFREGSKYHSPNYKFFSDCENKFLYIDRVVIKKEYRRMGAGTLLYNHLSKVANLPICCEVNTNPINQISLNFHSKNKYIKVGQGYFDDHSVAYLKRK